jgi:hypothetical protein
MTRTVLLMALAAVISTPAVAGDPSTPGQLGSKTDRSEDKVVCRFVNTTGSRLSRDRECKTRAQWDHESNDTREQFEQQEQRATGDATNPPH